MKRLVIYQKSAIDLLDDIIHSNRDNALLVICSTRQEFLAQLAKLSIDARSVPAADATKEVARDGTSAAVPASPLLPTLQVLSNSQKIKVAFCPDLDTLRSQLMTLPAFSLGLEQLSRRPLLQIVDLILLHRGTSEFSVQGIMRSLSSAVEGAATAMMDLQLCECNDAFDFHGPDRGSMLWDAEVPLVSESQRVAGQEAAWVQTTVPIRRIAGRWFEFEKGKSQIMEEVGDDEEMLLC